MNWSGTNKQIKVIEQYLGSKVSKSINHGVDDKGNHHIACMTGIGPRMFVMRWNSVTGGWFLLHCLLTSENNLETKTV